MYCLGVWENDFTDISWRIWPLIFQGTIKQAFQCSPFLLSDRQLFFVAIFYSVFSFFRRCAQVRVIATKIIQKILYISNFMLLLATAILFYFQHVSLNSFSCNFPYSKRDFITIFFKCLDFSFDSFAFSTQICLFLSFPQMFMAVLKSNSESYDPCLY